VVAVQLALHTVENPIVHQYGSLMHEWNQGGQHWIYHVFGLGHWPADAVIGGPYIPQAALQRSTV
jgi:hypothetical protein